MRNSLGRFVFATLVLGVAAYFLKGRDNGLSLWQTIIGVAIFIGINLLASFLSARDRRE